MILVTLGTQDKPFDRLLKAIDKEIKNGNIKDEVIVQAGYTKYTSKNMKIYDFIDRDNFNKYIKKCDLLITHGGVGSIMAGLENNKKVIAVPRLSRYSEHVNDHQVQIIDNFNKEGYILGVKDLKKFEKVLSEVDKFKPKRYKSNTNNMVSLICNYIDHH